MATTKLTHTIELTPDDVRQAIILWVATHFHFAPSAVDFTYAEVGGDSLDRFPGSLELASAKATLEVDRAGNH